MTDSCDFYCLSFDNDERKRAMQNRFKNLGIKAFIYEGVNFNDNRIAGRTIDDGIKRIWSFTYGHLDMIREFYFYSNKEYGIFCEDDIFIRKDFINQLPKIITRFNDLKLELLLLGYLINYNSDQYNKTFSPLFSENNEKFSFYNMPDFIWGAQMYMLTKSQAWELLNKYSSPYAELSLTNSSLKPFSADWTFTKEGKRAMIYPLIAIEDGKTQYIDESQSRFHQECYTANYLEGVFFE